MNRPNILYIHSHDTGRYIQPYGHAVPTPHLQKLAEQGTLFRNAHTVAPTCSPSRAGLLTGIYPHQNGMLGLAHRGFNLNDYDKHAASLLGRNGYRTILCGTQHVFNHRHPPERLYDEILDAPFIGTERVAPAIARFREMGDEPFFMSVGFFETHREFPEEMDADFDPRYTLAPAPLPDTPKVREDMARYKTMARVLDTAIGDLLNGLEEAGLAERTLVIFTTDHGIAFPAMKCNLTSHGTGVSMIWRGPSAGPSSVLNGGHCLDAMVCHLDVLPTWCEAAGVETPEYCEGKSLLPLVRGEVDALHESICGEVNWHASYEPKRSLRMDRWLYVRRYGDRRTPMLTNCDWGLSKSVWIDAGWPERMQADEELYDLTFDPQERHNVAGDPAQGIVLQDMRDRLDAWMERTGDRIAEGKPELKDTIIVVDDEGGTDPGKKLWRIHPDGTREPWDKGHI